MKKDIHPEYVDCHVKCGCGNEFTTRGVVKSLSVEICSACHPFFTGKEKFVDAAGRVDRFRKRYGAGAESASK
ncbi:MAG: 50S ribosomal protein L31 [Planctomycetota bacterium]|nr:MAG: 50S ribosomal protein L31 [Planctomycetota bacterium]